VDWVRVARSFAGQCGKWGSERLRKSSPHIRQAALSAVPTFAAARALLPAVQRAHLAPAVIGLGIWIGFPSTVALQDMTGMITGADASGVRWNAFVAKSVAGSVQSADMPFLDKNIETGSISGGGVNVPGVGSVAFRGKAARPNPVPDEARVVRGDKKGRIVQIAPVAPPKAFNAGSVLDRTSSLLRPTLDTNVKLAFRTVKPTGKEVQMASAFQVSRPKNFGVPSYLASLVTSDKADVLATAYAPPTEASASPFDLLLNEQPAGGRFIPPMGKGDHAWLETPLPASVFSEKEQTCLANAIYFEARGESLRGQAAVAQVVLNRVRNPTYPDTICSVVYQNENWRNACQFSFACDGKKDRVLSQSNYRKAKDIALAVTAGKIFLPEVGSSTHYYAQYVSPGWARAMKKMTTIGLHIFYRTRNGGWS
jgi:spore germination cell wall hydrolase CwlJ-like protein